MRKAALYTRISILDQCPQAQLFDLRKFAQQSGFEIAHEYQDFGTGMKARRPGLEKLLQDAHRRRFEVVLVWSCDKIAKSTKHLLRVIDEFLQAGVQFVATEEGIDTDGPLGRAIDVMVSASSRLERSLMVERVRAGMHRAKLEGRRIGRAPLDVDRAAVVRDRALMSLSATARKYGLSRASVVRLVKEARASSLSA